MLDKTGAVSGMSGTQQMVQLRLQTVRGSSALANFGKASTPTVVSANTLRQMRADITVALNDMVISKMIVVNSISLSQVQPWQINGFVLWTDLTTGVESRNDL